MNSRPTQTTARTNHWSSSHTRRSRLRLLSSVVVAGVLCAANVAGQVRLQEVVSGAGTPVAITHAGDERLFITDRAGRVLILRSGRLETQPFLDISGRVRSGGEQGLLSIAFHPKYSAQWPFLRQLHQWVRRHSRRSLQCVRQSGPGRFFERAPTPRDSAAVQQPQRRSGPVRS